MVKTNPEWHAQKAVFNWAAMMLNEYPALKWLFAVPNGGKRNIKEAAGLKKTGVKPGVSDIMLLFPSGGYHGLLIEMKAPYYYSAHKRKPTPKQLEFLKWHSQNGYYTAVCYGSNEAINLIERYLLDKVKK